LPARFEQLCARILDERFPVVAIARKRRSPARRRTRSCLVEQRQIAPQISLRLTQISPLDHRFRDGHVGSKQRTLAALAICLGFERPHLLKRLCRISRHSVLNEQKLPEAREMKDVDIAPDLQGLVAIIERFVQSTQNQASITARIVELRQRLTPRNAGWRFVGIGLQLGDGAGVRLLLVEQSGDIGNRPRWSNERLGLGAENRWRECDREQAERKKRIPAT
jgi:hypothetical protein